MGCCQSSTDIPHEQLNSHQDIVTKQMKVANKQIGTELRDAKRGERAIKKLLLLGTGSSGKSTLFKTLKDTHKPYEDIELEESKHIIRQNIIAGMLTLLKKSQQLYEHDNNTNEECLIQMNDKVISSIQLVVSYGSESFAEALDFDKLKQLGKAVLYLWELDSVKSTYYRRGSNFSFPDNMDYFFDNVREIMLKSYSPSKEDMLRARVRTAGIIFHDYEAKGNQFKIYDVGGQRNERKKWIHQFDNVSAVLFVIALNHYNAVLFEDEKKNAMHEAIELFGQICNSKFFRKSEMILFLNKDDLFKRKILQQISLSTCFSYKYGWNGKQWNGPNYIPSDNDIADDESFTNCYSTAISFIQDIFVALNQVKSKIVFCHVTCATDSNTVEKVFWDVQNIVIRSNLRKGGLMI